MLPAAFMLPEVAAVLFDFIYFPLLESQIVAPAFHSLLYIISDFTDVFP